MTEIRVPTLGESVTEATIGRWFKKAGDAVAVDEPLVELETDKVTIEVPAPSAGTLGEIAAKDGETVAVGALLGQINDGFNDNEEDDDETEGSATAVGDELDEIVSILKRISVNSVSVFASKLELLAEKLGFDDDSRGTPCQHRLANG